ncbi:MAG: hypothetical protein O7D35_05525, partial [Acidobacteria bacterium]|nr:hypothetical protein [Acidobacteriota bacterium]
MIKTVSHILPPVGLKFSDWPAGHLALSPDGHSLAYVTYGYEYGAGNAAAGADDRQLWVRDFDDPEPRLLPGTGSVSHPFWSPDGRSLAYFTAGALRRIDAEGGSPMTLAEISFTKGGTWSRNGTILYAPSRFGSPLWRVPAKGGEPRPATDLNGQDNVTHRWPCFLPDGEHFIYTVQATNEPPSLHLANLDGSMDHILMTNASNGLYADGRLIYARDTTLLFQPFDLDQLQLTGEPEILVSPVAQWGGKADYTVSPGGTLVYTQNRKARGALLSLYDHQGRPLRTVSSPTALDDLAISPDGRYLALSRDEPDSESFDIWTYDITRDIFTRITFDGNGDDPAWSPDGKWIAYAHGGDLYRKRASGAGTDEELFSSTGDKVAHDWSQDGKTILFAGVGQSGAENLWILPLEEGAKPHAILDGPYRETHGQF